MFTSPLSANLCRALLIWFARNHSKLRPFSPTSTNRSHTFSLNHQKIMFIWSFFQSRPITNPLRDLFFRFGKEIAVVSKNHATHSVFFLSNFTIPYLDSHPQDIPLFLECSENVPHYQVEEARTFLASLFENLSKCIPEVLVSRKKTSYLPPTCSLRITPAKTRAMLFPS